MIDIKTIAEKAKDQIKSITQKEPVGVISIEKDGTKWKVLVEILERKAIPDTQDLIGIYELVLTDNGAMTSYKQIEKRHRGIPYAQRDKEE